VINKHFRVAVVDERFLKASEILPLDAILAVTNTNAAVLRASSYKHEQLSPDWVSHDLLGIHGQTQVKFCEDLRKVVSRAA